MKFTKLSLAAIAAVGFASSAFAVENVKVDGQLKLWYQTTDSTTVSAANANAVDTANGNTNQATANDTAKNDGFLKQKNSIGDLVAKLRATGDLTKKVGFGTTLYAVSTMGLENGAVANETLSTTAAGSNAGLNGNDRLPIWMGEAYFVYKAGKTIAKIGRQELDTPLAFSETWNAAPNTFEAAVLVNQDLPDTTLVAAYVSRGNGQNGTTGFNLATNTNGLGVNSSTINANGTFASYHNNSATLQGILTANGITSYTATGQDKGGAFAAGLVNKSIPGLTIHPVYYNVTDTATAAWIDVTYTGLPMVKVEALYSYVDATGATRKTLDAVAAALADGTASDKKTDAYAVKVSGGVAGVNLGASYSSVSAGVFPIANTATNFTKTKIYTASILSDGRVAAQPDVTAWKLEASTKLAGFDLGASYASYDVKENKKGLRLFDQYGLNKDKSPSEIDLSIGTKVDEINVAAYYIMQNDYATVGTESRDRQAIRVIASINF